MAHMAMMTHLCCNNFSEDHTLPTYMYATPTWWEASCLPKFEWLQQWMKKIECISSFLQKNEERWVRRSFCEQLSTVLPQWVCVMTYVAMWLSHISQIYCSSSYKDCCVEEWFSICVTKRNLLPRATIWIISYISVQYNKVVSCLTKADHIHCIYHCRAGGCGIIQSHVLVINAQSGLLPLGSKATNTLP